MNLEFSCSFPVVWQLFQEIPHNNRQDPSVYILIDDKNAPIESIYVEIDDNHWLSIDFVVLISKLSMNI